MKCTTNETPPGTGGAHAFVDRRTYEYYGVQLHCILVPRGILRRKLIIHSRQLRALLGVPQRQDIEPLKCEQNQLELRTSELWEQAEALALPRLQQVYAEVHRIRALAAVEQAARRAQRRLLGRPLTALQNPPEARGILLHAGDSGQGYQLYMWDPQALELLTLANPALREALASSRARPGETIQVRRHALPASRIEEERAGTYGERRRTLTRRAERYEIVRVPSPALIRDSGHVA